MFQLQNPIKIQHKIHYRNLHIYFQSLPSDTTYTTKANVTLQINTDMIITRIDSQL